MTESLKELIEERNGIYDHEDGQEQTENGQLEETNFQIFQNQKEHIDKLRHLLEFEHKSETARKALDVGLLVLSTDFISEEDAQELFEHVEDAKAGEL